MIFLRGRTGFVCLPFWLKPFILAQACLCSRGTGELFLLFVRRRAAMVRKGWTKVVVPDGWLQVIRGKRPPSVQWPRAGSQQHVRQTGKPAQESRNSPKTSSPPARAKKRFLQHDATIAAAREALLKAEHDKEVDVQGVADGEDLLRKLKTHVADANRGSCWRSGPAPASGRGFATT